MSEDSITAKIHELGETRAECHIDVALLSDLWEKSVCYLKESLDQQIFTAWIKPLSLGNVSLSTMVETHQSGGSRVTLRMPFGIGLPLGRVLCLIPQFWDLRMRDTISPDLLIPEQKTFFIIDVI